MKRIVSITLLCLPFVAFAQDQKPDRKPLTLRGILLDQLKTTHNENDWFVPANVAVQGLTADQGNCTDGKGNHSIGQLAYHLVFWNTQELAKFKGETPPKYSGKNDDTFYNFDAKQWTDTVKELDQIMIDLEKFVETADD